MTPESAYYLRLTAVGVPVCRQAAFTQTTKEDAFHPGRGATLFHLMKVTLFTGKMKKKKTLVRIKASAVG